MRESGVGIKKEGERTKEKAKKRLIVTKKRAESAR